MKITNERISDSSNNSMGVKNKSIDEFVLSKEDIEAILKYHKKKQNKVANDSQDTQKGSNDAKKPNPDLKKGPEIDIKMMENKDREILEHDQNREEFEFVGQYIDIYA